MILFVNNPIVGDGDSIDSFKHPKFAAFPRVSELFDKTESPAPLVFDEASTFNVVSGKRSSVILDQAFYCSAFPGWRRTGRQERKNGQDEQEFSHMTSKEQIGRAHV